MKNKNFLLEIGVEELPARHCQSILRQLNGNMLKDILGNNNLKLINHELYITPRRIVLQADSIEQLQVEQEIRGPIYDVAFDDDKPNQIADKFAQSHGKTAKDIIIKKQNGKKFLFVVKDLSGELHSEINQFLKEVIEQLHFDRAMRWDNSGLEFSRPIRWITCLIGNKSFDLTLGNIKSGKTSYGNRFQESPKLEVENAKEYMEKMEKNFIMVDQTKRRTIIKKALEELKNDGLTTEGIASTEDLIDEVCYLIEWPTPLLCTFDEEFLDIPKEIIVSVLSKHQKYFALMNKKKISNKFLVITNFPKESDIVRKGNEKVVRARLNDAAFFLDQDLKHDFEYFRKITETITFQEKLGSMMDKSKRLQKSAVEIAKHIAKDIDINKVEKAAKYCKTDLSTAMVTEFTSLEGTIGRIYAQKMGFDKEVATAIEEHYQPRHSSDQLPQSELGTILALADKMDTLYGMFSIGIKPKGNSDPYGLRRAAIAITRILWEKDITITLDQLIEYAGKPYTTGLDSTELKEFMYSRLEQNLQEKEILENTNLLRSIVHSSTSSLNLKKSVITDIKQYADTSKIEDFIEMAKRIYNIAIKSNPEYQSVNLNETSLNETEAALAEKTAELTDDEDSDLEELLSLTKPATRFFEENMVMAKEAKDRDKRLTILRKTYDEINKHLNVRYLIVAKQSTSEKVAK